MIPKSEVQQETKYREDLKQVCQLAYQKGLISGYDGNFSLKVSNEFILITPKDSHKGLIEPKDFVIVDINGNCISNGNKEPSSDLSIHLEVYKKRTDIKAIVHAHPQAVISFSICGHNFNQPVIPELILLLGEVPLIPYPGPNKEKETKLTISCLEKHDAVILERHGALTTGKNILNAFYKMEVLENAAKIMLYAQSLGDLKILDEIQIDELIKERHKMHGKDLELREGSKLFQNTKQTLTLKNIFKRFTEKDSPVFQRILTLINEIMLITIQSTNYSQKLSNDEKEQLSRELTSSLLHMLLGRFTQKK